MDLLSEVEGLARASGRETTTVGRMLRVWLPQRVVEFSPAATGCLLARAFIGDELDAETVVSRDRALKIVGPR